MAVTMTQSKSLGLILYTIIMAAIAINTVTNSNNFIITMSSKD